MIELFPTFAGALWSSEDVDTFVTIIGFGGLACLAIFVRSVQRLLTHEEKSTSDTVIVSIGFLLLTPIAVVWAGAAI